MVLSKDDQVLLLAAIDPFETNGIFILINWTSSFTI